MVQGVSEVTFIPVVPCTLIDKLWGEEVELSAAMQKNTVVTNSCVVLSQHFIVTSITSIVFAHILVVQLHMYT